MGLSRRRHLPRLGLSRSIANCAFPRTRTNQVKRSCSDHVAVNENLNVVRSITGKAESRKLGENAPKYVNTSSPMAQ
jgi:hypothetical protein